MSALPQAVPAHASPAPERTQHRGGTPGDPRLTAGTLTLIEEQRARYAVPRNAFLAALGLTPGTWRDWTSGRYRIRESKCKKLIAKSKLIQGAIDADAIRALPSGPRRRDAFLAAATIAVNSTGIA